MIALLLLAAVPDEAAVHGALARAPADVRLFEERRDRCDHWEGEDPYDPARGREMARALNGLDCDRLGRDERALRLRYRRRPDLLRLLDTLRAESEAGGRG